MKMGPLEIKALAGTVSRVVKDILKPIKQRLTQIEHQGDAINGNFADMDKRLTQIEDLLTDPGQRG